MEKERQITLRGKGLEDAQKALESVEKLVFHKPEKINRYRHVYLSFHTDTTNDGPTYSDGGRFRTAGVQQTMQFTCDKARDFMANNEVNNFYFSCSVTIGESNW